MKRWNNKKYNKKNNFVIKNLGVELALQQVNSKLYSLEYLVKTNFHQRQRVVHISMGAKTFNKLMNQVAQISLI